MSDRGTPVQVTTRFSTTVQDLPAAWAFVMSKIDKVGPDPHIEIQPEWVGRMEDPPDAPWPRHFGVIVSGSIEEAASE